MTRKSNVAVKQVYSIHIEAPLAKVWESFTTPRKRLEFYFDSVLQDDLEVGRPLEYRSADGSKLHVQGEVLTLQAPTLLEHTWRFPSAPDELSRITLRLEPEAKGTRLTLIHEELGDAPQTATEIAVGWPFVLENLKLWLETGDLLSPPRDPRK
jgi:uncharacterized protein YndB with AHSA1/START domain